MIVFSLALIVAGALVRNVITIHLTAGDVREVASLLIASGVGALVAQFVTLVLRGNRSAAEGAGVGLADRRGRLFAGLDVKIPRTLGLVLLAAAFPLVSAGSAQAASIWTPIPSGTTDTISAIVYQSPSRFWYATTNGTIAYFNGSAFVAASGSFGGENFTDLAFEPTTVPGGPGTTLSGYAVTSNGDVWQSHDGGKTWTQLLGLTTKKDVGGDGCSSTTDEQVPELNAVVFASDQVVYLLGQDGTLLKSGNAGSLTPTFHEINKNGSGTCAAQNDRLPQNLTDAVFLPFPYEQSGFMIGQEFGQLYSTSNGFRSGTGRSDPLSSYTGNPRMALDAANPNRIWAVDHTAGGAGCGAQCLGYSTDGGNTYTHPTFPNALHVTGGLYDVSSQGGVEVAAGSAGEIVTSLDGSNFYLQPADGALTTENWRAEDAFDAAHAAVGGEGGALAVTTAANTIPDIIAPTGTISGPATVSSGHAATYTASVSDNTGGSGINPSGYTWSAPGFPAQHGASASYTFPRGAGSATITLMFTDNAGNQGTATLDVTVNDVNPSPRRPRCGSNRTTRHAGGVTVKVFKTVTVTGCSSRFVPVTVTAIHGRKVIVRILTAKGRRQVASARVTLKHGGRRTLHVRLPNSAKPGSYLISFRVLNLKGHRIGPIVTVPFRLI